MKTADILDQLLLELERQNIEIRKEKMGGSGGGLCRLKSKTIFYVDTQSSQSATAMAVASALDALIDVEMIYLRPEIREFVSRHSENTNKG